MSNNKSNSLLSPNGVVVITAKLSKFVRNILPSFNKKHVIPTFRGQNHENPDKFIQALVDYFLSSNIPRSERIPFAAQMMKGVAEETLTHITRHSANWEEFVSEIKERYGSPRVTAELRLALFDEEQEDDQSVVEFLKQKKALARRLHPEMDEESFAASMVQLLKQDVRKCLNYKTIKNVSGLIQQAKRIEHNLNR